MKYLNVRTEKGRTIYIDTSEYTLESILDVFAKYQERARDYRRFLIGSIAVLEITN